MLSPRNQPYRTGILTAGVLATAAMVGLTLEVLRPGHHIHLGGVGHHHHFFVGDHTHEYEHEHDHEHRSVKGADCGSVADLGHDEPSEQQPEPDFGPGLIQGFTLEAPKAPIVLSAPILMTSLATLAVDVLSPVSPVYSPGGARAPPSVPLV